MKNEINDKIAEWKIIYEKKVNKVDNLNLLEKNDSM